MRRHRERYLEEAMINLTSLIDVVFVILILFIVVAPLLEVDRVELATSLSLSHPAQQGDHPIIIHVFANEEIQLNKRPVTLTQLKSLLAEANVHRPHARPQLFHDRKATFGTYQSIKNAIEAAGFTEMDVLLQPE